MILGLRGWGGAGANVSAGCLSFCVLNFFCEVFLFVFFCRIMQDILIVSILRLLERPCG